MNCLKNKYLLNILIIITIFFQTSEAQENFSIKISVKKNQIEYGNPFVLSLNLTFQQPQISERTGKPLNIIEIRELDIRIEQKDTSETSIFPFIMPIDFTLHDLEGIQYTANTIIWCQVYKERQKLIKRVIFDKPGDYKLNLLRSKKEVSNTIDIEIKPSSKGEKALSLLDTPEDCAFLLDGLYKSPDTVSCLEEVVSQCEGTEIAKWGAARLGIEEAEELEDKYPDGEKFMEQYRQGEIKEPLVELANTHLSIAYKLPDEFPVREAALNKLAVTELMNGNYKRVFSLFDELAAKYPNGEYGKRAVGDKEGFKVLMERYPEQVEDVEQTQTNKLFGFVLPITVAAVVGLFIIGGILLFKKKAKTKGQ